MTELPFVITEGTYRRRIELRPRPGVVTAAMEDYLHHFALRLHHTDGVVTGVDLSADRTPWTTCGDGARGLAALIGTPLASVGDVTTWIGSRSSQCVHTTDLAVLAAAAALRGEDRDYEVRMTDLATPERRITMWIDGAEWATWVIAANAVVDDDRSGRFAGLPLDAAGFSQWMTEHLADDEREPAAVLRRASSIGIGRGIAIDSWDRATEASNPPESCHSFRSDIVQLGRRNRGSQRATEDDALGAALPAPASWESLTSHD